MLQRGLPVASWDSILRDTYDTAHGRGIYPSNHIKSITFGSRIPVDIGHLKMSEIPLFR